MLKLLELVKPSKTMKANSNAKTIHYTVLCQDFVHLNFTLCYVKVLKILIFITMIKNPIDSSKHGLFQVKFKHPL